MHWLRDGDSNTKFFHMSATIKNKMNKIEKLINDDNIEVREQNELCEVARRYFDTLFQQNNGEHDAIINLVLPKITVDDNMRLTAPITKEELRQALFQMHPDKSSGPDGFNLAFYQHFWNLCNDDIFAVVQEWLERDYFPTSLNETNICLIPKCDKPTNMKDLRPISLCNVLYKMVSKLLANRLKSVLDKCISEEQSAFLEGRANANEAQHLLRILKEYEKASGQQINLAKSEVFISNNMSSAAKEDLANILGVRHAIGTGPYLGLPSMIGRSKKDTFNFIKDRIWKRMNSWRGRTLSKAECSMLFGGEEAQETKGSDGYHGKELLALNPKEGWVSVT
ncbi:CNGC5-like protein [Trifolium medium]|uniref:CNGC5-like protein n=1 Tax=Trifolium medium TaxID=97028 RepID=A0A392MIX8_9FABA|nr:CNGC5-like protein [Trifolium medium]